MLGTVGQTNVSFRTRWVRRQYRVMRTRRAVLAGLVWAGLMLFHAREMPAQQPIRVEGRVQWIGGTSMQVMTSGGTVPIDLRQADQASYRALRNGERVIVDGVVASDRRSIVAWEIWRDGAGVESP
jgi:hypothetical protein